ncbi:MAG: c-type cytochrome [Pseudomonadota bacterium]
MSMRKSLAAWLTAACIASALAAPPGPDLGRPLAPENSPAVLASVFPDGTGLPAGEGLASRGESLFTQQCSGCHGPAGVGVGGAGPELAYAQMPLDSEFPDKTIASYWPYATTVWDFIRRAMPMNAPGSLSGSEVYDLTAYLLMLNGLWPKEALLTREALIAIEMPNRDGFIIGPP